MGIKILKLLCFIYPNKSSQHKRYSKKITIAAVIDKIMSGNKQNNADHPYETKKIPHTFPYQKITIVCKEPVLFLTADTSLTNSFLDADVVLDHNK